ncbi:MAG: tetratricopeptide repeat protein [Pseudomonadota bacterium]
MADVGLSQELSAALELHRNGDLEAAEKAYSEVLVASPDDADALHYLGMLMFQTQRRGDAIDKITRSLEVNPNNPSALNNMGNIFIRLRRHKEAMEVLRLSISLNPEDAAPWVNMGALMRHEKQVEFSKELLEHAISLAPEMGEAWMNLGLTAYVLKEADLAVKAFETSARLDFEGTRAPMWFALVLCELGHRKKAAELLEEMLAKDPDNETMLYQLQAMRGDDLSRAPDEYVRQHFDRFSTNFESVLENLEYVAPSLVAQAVETHLAAKAGLRILDLGCGTGLAGALIVDRAAHLEGIDLSPGMLARAEEREIYHELREAELDEFLQTSPAEDRDLIICVDTLCYIGDLSATLPGFARVLRPGATAIATVEKLEDVDKDFTLTISGRYAHSLDYLTGLAAAAGLEVIAHEEEVLRKELGTSVTGYVLVMRKSEQLVS